MICGSTGRVSKGEWEEGDEGRPWCMSPKEVMDCGW